MAESKKPLPGELAKACQNGKDKEALRLIAAGADPNAQTDGGKPALAGAARRGSVSLVKALLGAGADPNFGSPANMQFAALSEHRSAPQIIEMMLAAGGDPNAGGGRNTPLFCALGNGCPLDIANEKVKALLAGGADPLIGPPPCNGYFTTVLNTPAAYKSARVSTTLAKAMVERGGRIAPTNVSWPDDHEPGARALVKFMSETDLTDMLSWRLDVYNYELEGIVRAELTRRADATAKAIGKAAKKPKKTTAEKPAGETRKTDTRV